MPAVPVPCRSPTADSMAPAHPPPKWAASLPSAPNAPHAAPSRSDVPTPDGDRQIRPSAAGSPDTASPISPASAHTTPADTPRRTTNRSTRSTPRRDGHLQITPDPAWCPSSPSGRRPAQSGPPESPTATVPTATVPAPGRAHPPTPAAAPARSNSAERIASPGTPKPSSSPTRRRSASPHAAGRLPCPLPVPR